MLMSVPPGPGSFGSAPPDDGRSPSWRAQPPAPSFGAPYPRQPGGQPHWGPQSHWSGGQPQNKGGKGKWILGGVAIAAIVALTIVGTVLVLQRDPNRAGNGSASVAHNGDSEFASANDTGPVTIITDDPTCAAWNKIAVEYVAKTKSVNWADRDFTVTAAQWTPAQRHTFETVGKAMSLAADQAGNLVKRTPHRVMRELYSQFIAYAGAFTPEIPTYTQADDSAAVTTDSLVTALSNICSAISYGAAAPVEPMIPTPEPPASPASRPEDNPPARFLSDGNKVCGQWEDLGNQFSKDTETWRSPDLDIPAAQWTPEQRSINEAVAKVMTANADSMERLGRDSGNAVLEDFAVLAAQYRRGFVAALPTYTSVDNFLSEAASLTSTSITWACKAST